MTTIFQSSPLSAESLPSQLDHINSIETIWGEHPEQCSAVCLLFLPGQKEAEVILTKRSHKVRTHKGQIGLPGGRRDARDKTPTATAFRETEEEIGIPREQLVYHGQLPPIVGIDGHHIWPIVASSTWPLTDLNMNPNEVAEIIPVSWSLLTHANSSNFTFKLFGKTRTSYLYLVDNHKVWGITANIIYTANPRRH